MKYNIHGFFQPRAVELGLTNDDLLVLRWFVDFSNTSQMKTMLEPDGVYYWVNYSKILEDLPVLKVSKDRLKKKHFNKLCEVNILKHKHLKQGGSFSYYAIGENYESLIKSTPTVEMTNPTSKKTDPYGRNDRPPTVEMTEGYVKNDRTKINLLNNSSIKDNSIKDINYVAIVNRLNELAGTNYKPTSKNTQDLIKARINEGNTEKDLITVIEKMCYLWNKEPKKGEKDMRQYLRPSTLFRASNFENYLNMPVEQRKLTTKDISIDISDF